MNVALWIVQGLLAALFLFAGGAKLVLPLDQMAGPVALPGWFLRFLGVAEVLGALGLVLPGLLRIRPGLTPLAAAGLVIIMIGATVVTLVGGMVAVALMNVVVALLAAFVAYGRWRLAPYRDSSRQSVLRPASSGPPDEHEAALSEGTDDEHWRILHGVARSHEQRHRLLRRLTVGLTLAALIHCADVASPMSALSLPSFGGRRGTTRFAMMSRTASSFWLSVTHIACQALP